MPYDPERHRRRSIRLRRAPPSAGYAAAMAAASLSWMLMASLRRVRSRICR